MEYKNLMDRSWKENRLNGYLVGGIPTPLKKWKSVGIIIPSICQDMEKYKNKPPTSYK